MPLIDESLEAANPSVYYPQVRAELERDVKIALVQINPVIGDFEYNSKKILNYSQKAAEAGCRLVIFPELVVSGYPPLDLLERGSFVNDHELAVATLINNLPDIDVMFGAFERRAQGAGKPLYNSALVCRNGEIIHRTRKQLLPAYDVFDENRYFEPGEMPEIYRVDDTKIAVTVCEDIWNEAIGEYQVDPVANLLESGEQEREAVDIVVNVSASPFHRGKNEIRRDIFSRFSREYQVPFIYVNQVGGQDSLLFDGHSQAIDRRGEVVARAAFFEEDMVIVDTGSWTGEKRKNDESSDLEDIHDALVMGIRDYVGKTGFRSVVLGLSGGIDSALTAALAVEALGPDNVLGVALPSPYSSRESIEDAEALAVNCGCRFEVLRIGGLFQSYRDVLADLFAGQDEDVTEQNIQARIRGNLLMSLSNKFGHLLLTTGNKSEMAVGYCTLYGDMSGGLAVISDVPKQLVYDLARFVNREREIIPERTITKAPSAELRPDQSDQDDLPPYEILDSILELYLENGQGRSEIIKRGFEPEIVDDVIRRIRINEYKRKQAPIGLKVTSKAFGFGRRLPNVQNYRE